MDYISNDACRQWFLFLKFRYMLFYKHKHSHDTHTQTHTHTHTHTLTHTHTHAHTHTIDLNIVNEGMKKLVTNSTIQSHFIDFQMPLILISIIRK